MRQRGVGRDKIFRQYIHKFLLLFNIAMNDHYLPTKNENKRKNKPSKKDNRSKQTQS